MSDFVPQESFVVRRPVVTGIIIGLIIGLPLVFYLVFYFSSTSYNPPENEFPTNQITVVKNLNIRGNRRSRIYHLPECPNYESIAQTNIVPFKTQEEARAAGYRIAGNCP